MRRVLGFVKRFIQTVLVPEGAPSVLPASVLLDTLRAQTSQSLVDAYRRFRKQHGPVTLPVFRSQINVLSVLFHNILGVLRQPLTLVCFGIPTVGPRRRKRHMTLSEGVTGTEDRRLCHRAPIKTMDVEDFDSSELLRPGNPSNHERVHTFTAEEIRRLYLACETLMEKILMPRVMPHQCSLPLQRTALFTTGMRIDRGCASVDNPGLNGFCAMLWPPGGQLGHEITTIEKGNVRMSYGLSTVLRQLLQEYMACQTDTGVDRCYVFPHRDLPRCHATTASARSTFMRVAHRAGLHGPHVHPHTTRHSVVMDC